MFHEQNRTDSSSLEGRAAAAEGSVPQALKVLIVEDSALDCELVVQELCKAGFAPEWQRVETEAAYLAGLQSAPDLVFSDFHLPRFNGLRALELLQQRGPDIPFILVSGTIGEDTAVAAMRQGATDYLLKDRLARLGSAVARALSEKRALRDRQRMDREQAENAEFVRTVLDSLASAVAVLDEFGAITATNERWRRVGRENGGSENATLNYLDVCDASVQRSGHADARAAAAGIRRVLAGGTTEFSMEYPCHSPHEQRWFLMHVSPLGGTKRGVVIAHENTTERNRAAARLLASQQRLSLAAKSAHIGIWDWDVAANSMVWDAQMLALHGFREQDFDGGYESWLRALHPEDRSRCEAAFAAALVGPRGFHLEFRIVRPDGEVRDIEAHAEVTRAEDGSPSHVIGVNWDVTEKQRTKSALSQSEEHFRRLIENSSDVITVVNGAGIIFYQSPSTLRILGYQPEEVLGQAVTSFIHPEDRGKAAQGILRALSDPLHSVPVEYRIRHRDGTWRVFQSIGRAMGHSTVERKVVVNSRDVTEMNKLELQFLRAQRLEAIGTLSSGIAHDLNNILAPMLMIAPMLREKASDPQDQELLTMIEQGALRGANIIKQLLTFSRGVEGERGPVQVGHLLKEIVGLIRETFPRELTFGVNIPESLWPINGDATQIHQVLLNLCVNARDAMPAGGKLSLSAINVILDDASTAQHPATKPGPFVRLTITDTGQGISRENLDRIFEPFFTTKEVGKGTGLGLSTVLGIVKSHGGFVTVYSEPGLGTTFNVQLPAIPGTVATIDDAVTRPQPGRRELILVVDDEAAIRRSLSLALEKENYRVVVAADGREALTVFEINRGSIRLLLTDLMMPGMNGVTLIRLLRAQAPHLRIIAASGLHDEERRAELAALDVTSLLAKPFRTEEVLEAVNRELAVGG